jgi:hypothetical protein
MIQSGGKKHLTGSPWHAASRNRLCRGDQTISGKEYMPGDSLKYILRGNPKSWHTRISGIQQKIPQNSLYFRQDKGSTSLQQIKQAFRWTLRQHNQKLPNNKKQGRKRLIKREEYDRTFSGSPPLSGWFLMANFLYAFFSSSCDAVLETPRTL